MANKNKNLELIKSSFLQENEKIIYAIIGAYETKSLGADTVKNGVLAATNERIIFCAKRLSGYDSEIFHYDKISTFELSKKLMGNTISFYLSGNNVSIKWINDKELDEFVKYVNEKIKGIQKETSKTVENKKIVENDIELESLKKIKLLKELLDIEAITQEEYDAKKKKLLGL